MKRYKNTKTSKSTPKFDSNGQSVLKYNTIIYEPVPQRNDDILVITQEGDRFDNLAFQYYGDPSLWWFIARANNMVTMNVEVGTHIRVPANTAKAKGN